MIQYFNSRDLSKKIGINLARWKRWSREFLPPDPLGGKQSGYARQYTLNEAFTVFLGGHLVGNLGLSMPEAKSILKYFGEWMMERNLFSIQDPLTEPFSHETSSNGLKAGLVIFGGLNKKSSFFIQESANPQCFNLDLSRGDGYLINASGQPETTATRAGSVEPSGMTSAKILFLHVLAGEFKNRLNL
jgi:hypothetical protein